MDASTTVSPPITRRPLLRALRHALVFGAIGALTTAALALIEYRFFVIERSIEMAITLVALLFAGLGIWLGAVRRATTVVVQEVPVPVRGPFVLNEKRLRELGITAREREVLSLMADGLSNREIANRLCVSENTVKTHSSHVFDKLGAKRRTHAVQIAKASGLIP